MDSIPKIEQTTLNRFAVIRGQTNGVSHPPTAVGGARTELPAGLVPELKSRVARWKGSASAPPAPHMNQSAGAASVRLRGVTKEAWRRGCTRGVGGTGRCWTSTCGGDTGSGTRHTQQTRTHTICYDSTYIIFRQKFSFSISIFRSFLSFALDSFPKKIAQIKDEWEEKQWRATKMDLWPQNRRSSGRQVPLLERGYRWGHREASLG